MHPPASLPHGPCRFWDIIPAEHTGVPQWYIIHAWSASFSETVASVVESLAPNPGPGEPPWPPGHKAGITLWIGKSKGSSQGPETCSLPGGGRLSMHRLHAPFAAVYLCCHTSWLRLSICPALPGCCRHLCRQSLCCCARTCGDCRHGGGGAADL